MRRAAGARGFPMSIILKKGKLACSLLQKSQEAAGFSFQSLEPKNFLGGLSRPILRIEDVHLLGGHPQLAHSFAPRPVHVLSHLGRHLHERSGYVHHRRTFSLCRPRSRGSSAFLSKLFHGGDKGW